MQVLSYDWDSGLEQSCPVQGGYIVWSGLKTVGASASSVMHVLKLDVVQHLWLMSWYVRVNTLCYCTAPSCENYHILRCVFLAAPSVTAFCDVTPCSQVDRQLSVFRRNVTVPVPIHLSTGFAALCYSSLEPCRRLGLILHQNVPLSPETRVHLHDAAGDPGVAAVHLCRRVLYISLPLRGLFSTL
jgi:hypothetical protein